VQILIKNSSSLPLTNNWSFRPNATFEEMFRVFIQEDVEGTIRGPIEVGERES